LNTKTVYVVKDALDIETSCPTAPPHSVHSQGMALIDEVLHTGSVLAEEASFRVPMPANHREHMLSDPEPYLHHSSVRH
jgi:hypothetical protein